jgi:SAM-dependent methyltransferase
VRLRVAVHHAPLPGSAVACLYGTPARLHQRTATLHQAKLCGGDTAAAIAAAAVRHAPDAHRVLDIGRGRGTTSCHLARRPHPAQLLLVDRSAALLTVALHRARTAGAGPPAAVTAVRADFHHLPLPGGAIDAAVPRSASTTPPTPPRRSPRSPASLPRAAWRSWPPRAPTVAGAWNADEGGVDAPAAQTPPAQ